MDSSTNIVHMIEINSDILSLKHIFFTLET